MNVRDWPMGQIMQLPDCCFGRRFSVCAAVRGVEIPALTAWDISEIALPEKCVLWEVVIGSTASPVSPELASVRLALGDQLPESTDMMDALEPLVPGLGMQGAEPRDIVAILPRLVFHLRNPIAAMGRRLVLETTAYEGKSIFVQVVCEFSSIPTEAPDWLGNLRSP